MLPTVHLNGTSGKELFELNLAAATQLLGAIAALKKTCPNGRDFYTQGQNALLRAVDEHKARLAHLQAVYDQLQALVEHLADYA